MTHKKIFAALAVALLAAASLAACQSEPGATSNGSVTTTEPSGQLVLYQNAQPKQLQLHSQSQFDRFAETVTQAIKSAGDATPQWVSSVVTEEWLEPYWKGGEVLKITFAEARDVPIGSEHRTCDELLVIGQKDWVVFGKDGQYQSGPLVLPTETIQEILAQAQTIEEQNEIA